MSVLLAQPFSDHLPGDRLVNVDALTRRRLSELERMFDVGMERLEPLSALGVEGIAADPIRAANAFGKITTALRQITILERELLGLRKAPKRDGIPRSIAERMERGDPGRLTRLSLTDLDGRSGYSNGPLDQVIASLRKTLGVPTPPDDPFAPDAEAKEAARKAAAETRPVEAAEPDKKTGDRPAPDQKTLALKAARLALRANPRKGGFRRPKKTHKKVSLRPLVERHGQGPPG